MDLPQVIGFSRNMTFLLTTSEIIWESVFMQGSIWKDGDIFLGKVFALEMEWNQ
jgi:hypothetical protein